MDCCERIVNGLIIVTAGARRFEAEGDIELDVGGEERTARATASGYVVIGIEPMPKTWKCDFANICGDGDPMLLWDGDCLKNVTIIEVSRGRLRHLFTDCSIVGRPLINIKTGIVTGMMGAGWRYTAPQRLAA